MPMARSPRMSRSASVTRPAGFVKFRNHASGARVATRAASVRMTGSVRSANAMPPGPTVS